MACKKVSELTNQYGSNWQNLVRVMGGPYSIQSICESNCGPACANLLDFSPLVLNQPPSNGIFISHPQCSNKTLVHPTWGITGLSTSMIGGYSFWCSTDFVEWIDQGVDYPQRQLHLQMTNNIGFGPEYDELGITPEQWVADRANGICPRRVINSDYYLYRQSYPPKEFLGDGVSLSFNPGFPSSANAWFIENRVVTSYTYFGYGSNPATDPGIPNASIPVNCQQPVFSETKTCKLFWNYAKSHIKYLECINGVLIDKTNEAVIPQAKVVTGFCYNENIGTNVNYEFESFQMTDTSNNNVFDTIDPADLQGLAIPTAIGCMKFALYPSIIY